MSLLGAQSAIYQTARCRCFYRWFVGYRSLEAHMWARRMTSFRKVHTTELIAVAGVAIVLAGCSQGESQAQVAQAQQSAAQAQAQKDTQASLAAQVQQLKAQAAQTAAA